MKDHLNRDYMDLSDQVPDYVANRLTAAEVENFELQLLVDAALQEDVRVELALRRGAKAGASATANIDDEDKTEIPPAFMIPQVMYVEGMRRGQASEISVKPRVPVVLAIDVGPVPAETEYHLVLKDESSTVLLEVDQDADDECYVNIEFPMLPPGIYLLMVDNQQTERRLEFTIRCVG